MSSANDDRVPVGGVDAGLVNYISDPQTSEIWDPAADGVCDARWRESLATVYVHQPAQDIARLGGHPVPPEPLGRAPLRGEPAVLAGVIVQVDGAPPALRGAAAAAPLAPPPPAVPGAVPGAGWGAAMGGRRPAGALGPGESAPVAALGSDVLALKEALSDLKLVAESEGMDCVKRRRRKIRRMIP